MYLAIHFIQMGKSLVYYLILGKKQQKAYMCCACKYIVLNVEGVLWRMCYVCLQFIGISVLSIFICVCVFGMVACLCVYSFSLKH